MVRFAKIFFTASLAAAALECASPVAHAASSPAKAAQSVALLIKQGNGALANEDFKAARDEFSDALTLDPKNSTAMAGLGMSYAGLQDYLKAAPLLDRAAISNPNNRVMAYDAAAVHIDGNTAMRGAKILRDYLQAHPQPVDEPMGNALAIALGQADEQARKNSFYQVVSAFYKQYNARLEAASPGMKRWGIDWISASDFADKQAQIQSKQKELAEDNQKIAEADERLGSLKAQVPVMQQRVQTGFEFQDNLDRLNARVSEQQDRETQLISDRDALVAAMPAPTLPKTLNCVTQSTIAPPAVGGIAVADNVTPQATDAPQPKPKPAKKPRHVIPTPGGSTGDGTSVAGAGNTSATDPPIVPKGLTGDGGDTTPTPPVDTPTTDAPESPPVKKESVIQYAAAFPVAPDLLLTAAAPLTGATKIELLNAEGNPMQATLVRSDDASGLALLRLTTQKMAYLPLAADFRGGAIQCAAFPSVDLFSPTVEMLSGSAPQPADGWKVRLGKHPRLPGAPLLVAGKVIGVQLADRDALDTALPAATLTQLKTFLGTDLPATPGDASPATVLLQLSATKGGD